MLNRRNFLKILGAAPWLSGMGMNFMVRTKQREFHLIKNIESSIIWPGRNTGTSWFHPRACMVPDEAGLTALMTCQSITGSDVFGQVHWSLSGDNGQTWTDPAPIASLARRSLPDGIEEGVCDVVPEYHPLTHSVLAIGHNVYYKDGVLTRPHAGRYTVYVVRTAAGVWSERSILEWDHPETSGIYSAGCAQRVTLENGQILLPLSFGPRERPDRAVCTVRCRFDGQTLAVIESGNTLRLPVQRGLLEPSLTRLNGMFYVTLRAEDDRGYVTSSSDGLSWADIRPWRWEDGAALSLSSTQQRWLTHSDGLFLVYTRKAEHNINVMRWRAPLYVAQVDTDRLCLIRESEKIVFPLIGDGIHVGQHVARMGNFHVVNASAAESWVTVGEALPDDGWRGNTLLGRIHWRRPNRLVTV